MPEITLTSAQLRKQNEIGFFAAKLEQKLRSNTALTQEETIVLELVAGVPVTNANAAAPVQTLMAKLTDFRNNISQYYDASGSKIRDFDLNTNSRTSDDVQALQVVLGSRTGQGRYDSAIDGLEARVISQNAAIKAIPAGTTDQAQIKLKTKLERDLARTISQVHSTEVRNGTEGRTRDKFETKVVAAQAALAAIPAGTTNRRLLAQRTDLQARIAQYQNVINEFNIAAVAEQTFQHQQVIATQRGRMAGAGASAADLATFDALAANGVNADTLNTYEQAVVNPRSFFLWSGMLSQDIKGSYKQLADTNTRKEVIEAYTNLVNNGVDGVAGLETNSQHEMTRAVFIMMATRSDGWSDLRNLQVDTLKAMTKFCDDTTKGTQGVNRPVNYEALGPYRENGINIVLNSPNRSDAKIMEYINYAYANPHLTQAQYDAYAQSLKDLIVID
jgi:hypothetical protein